MSEPTEKYTTRPTAIISMLVEGRDKLVADTVKETLGVVIAMLKADIDVANQFGKANVWVLQRVLEQVEDLLAKADHKLIERG